MHRPTVGTVALVLLGAAVALWARSPDWDREQVLLAACVRVGLVMGAIWLAHPQLVKLPTWLPNVMLVVAIVVALKPKLIVIAVPLLLLLLWLRPRGGRRP